MRRSFTSLVALLLVAAFCLSCTDTQSTGPRRDSTSAAPGGCAVDVNSLRASAVVVFGSGTTTTTTVRDRIDEIDALLSAGDLAGAQANARLLVTFVQAHTSDLRGTAAQRDALVNTILCWVGITETSYVVEPSSAPQVLTSNDGSGAVLLPPNSVTEPTVITITVVESDLLTSDDTKLDRYPRSVSVTSSVPVGLSTVGVCVRNVPANVFARLRMGHRTKDGFKIEPPAPVDFLGCPSGSTASAATGVRGWLHSLASLVLPKPLYAKMQEELRSGGVGGTAGEYSPFEPVDTELFLSGGVGGTAGEYIRAPLAGAPTQGSGANTVAGGVCTAVEAPVGSGVEPECRPRIQVATANGTVLQNVPVVWAIASGGGSTASDNPLTRVCGTFASTFTAATNVNGKAGACWTVGSQPGANTMTATVGVGGDAPPGVSFNPPTQVFTATGIRITPTANALGEAVAYDGLEHPGSGSCSNGLIPALTYGGNGSVPRNVGAYVLTATCGSGSSFANTVTATAAITIGPAAPTIAITCPASVVYSGAAQAPCSATIRAPGLDLTATPAYTANTNAGTARATVNFAGTSTSAPATGSREFQITRAPTATTVSCPASVVYSRAPLTPCTVSVVGANLSLTPTPTYVENTNVGTARVSYSFDEAPNHLASDDSRTFAIRFAQSDCFTFPLANALPPKADFQVKGLLVPVFCGLRDAQGAAVTNASGSLLVEDIGPNGVSQPQRVAFAADAFTFGPDPFTATFGLYANWLNTDALTAGHYFQITATWNDGSTSTGYFYLGDGGTDRDR